MFKYLTEDYWEYFFKTIIRNDKNKLIHDGKRFEELTYSLLENLFRNENVLWLPTPETHDGNRDFYAKDSNGNILWAECKSYHNTIELKNIAATIVMVQINEVSEILFFSYSPINDNTKEKLIIYANQNNKRIYFYDDTNLENLIFKYRENIIPRFFPKFNYSLEMKIDYKPYIFTKYGNGIFVSTTESKINDKLNSQLNDIIYIGIGISNRNPQQDLCIKISMETENDLRYFELLDTQYKGESSCYYRISDTLLPMAAKFYTIFFRISVYKKNLKLPNLLIKYVEGDISESCIIQTPSVEVDHMFMTGLMGSRYHDILNEFKNVFFSNNCLRVNYLKGRSGVGKTRMLYEYINVLLTEKYQIINFTSVSQENSSVYIIKEIVYKLYNLSDELIIESLKNPMSHINVFGDDTIKIVELLQNIIQGNINALIKYEPLIFEKLIQTRAALLIDNIQYVDDMLIDFLLHYLLYAQNVNRPNNCIIILAQNMDYFENAKLKSLYLILNSLSENNFIKVSINELKGFEENQALGFLKAVVSFKDNSFNNILFKLVEKANNNPKLILEIAKYLRQRQIIRIQNDSLLLKNYSDLRDELKNFPLGNDNIIERRWKTYISNKPNLDKIKLLLSAIHFLGKVTIQLCKKVHLCFNYLDELCMVGFLATNMQNEYFFEHDIIENFFMKDIDFSTSIVDHLSTMKYIDINLQVWQKNLINIRKQDMSNYELETLLDFNFNKTLDIPYKWQLYYFDTVTNFLLKINDRINDKTRLIYSLHYICLKTKNVFGTETANRLYNIIYDNLEYTLGKERYKFRPYLELLDGYTENLLHMGAYNVISIYLKEINALEKYPDLFPDILGKLYNRVYVFFKDKREEHRVHNYYLMCDKICKENNLYELQMLNYFDAGTYYLYQNFVKSKLMIFWNKAFEIYDREKFDDAFLFVSKKKIQLYLLTKQFNLVKNELEEAQRYLNLFQNDVQQLLFFNKNFSTLSVIHLLISHSDNKELPIYLSKALDYNTQMRKASLFNIYFLYAKYYYSIDDIKKMNYYYELSLNELENQRDYIYYEHCRTIIYEDFKFKIACILACQQNNQEIFCQNQNDISSVIYKELHVLPLQKLHKYIKTFKTIAAVSSKDLKDGFLII